MKNTGGNLPSVFFFVSFPRLHFLTIMSTMTEREGKHEQETDNNAGNRGNGWTRLRTSGTWRTPRRTSSSWRSSPPSCAPPPCTTASPSPPLRMGNCRCRNRDSGNSARHHQSGTCGRNPRHDSCDSDSSGRSGSTGRRAAASTRGCHPHDNCLQMVIRLVHCSTSAGFLVNGIHTR